MDYKNAGADISGSNDVVAEIKRLAEMTYNEYVLAGVGSFGAVYDIYSATKEYKHPLLVQSADGVGTKLIIAKALGRLDVCGADLVNHCINDILCQGAEPLFFMDYIAQDRLGNKEILQLISGMASACKAANIALIGGEIVQMPDVYREERIDVAGFITGVVEKRKLIDGSQINPGDIIIGLPSTGLHTNGYSLTRKICSEKFDWSPYFWLLWIEELQERFGRCLLAPHKSYFPIVSPLLEKFPGHIHGIAHITGGGIADNISRILPQNCRARIRLRSWPILPIFQYIQKLGNIAPEEMYRVFNMGIGLALITAPNDAPKIFQELNGMHEPCYVIGEIIPTEFDGLQRVEFYEYDSFEPY